ncbi:MAG: hypothetical protein H7X86_10005, partial [Gorillibacterium sp.]|nr:hypothetical protein [Gorillibacterium sp.]
MRKWLTVLLCVVLMFSTLLGVADPVQATAGDYYDNVLGELEAKGINTTGAQFMYGNTEEAAMTYDDNSTPLVKEGNFKIDGMKSGDVSGELINVTDQPFTKAFRVRTGQRASDGQWWMASLKGMLVDPVQQGDVILLTFYAKNVTDNLNLTQMAV